jgi:ankyrin repeat protein
MQQMEHTAVVSLLLARADVDVNSKDLDGRMPASFVTRRGHSEIVRLLVTAVMNNI